MPIYKFRNCCLNSAERRVVKDRKYLELTPKTLDVLQLLVEKRGEVVGKDEILERQLCRGRKSSRAYFKAAPPAGRN